MMDAVETAEMIRIGKLSVREAIDAAIVRAEAACHLGAIVTETFEQARATAPVDGPLAGVPTFIKDLVQVAGVRTTWGSRGGSECTSKRTDKLGKRLLKAGAISLGKSATPELGLTATTEPLGREPARNPWDPTRSAGGSSGGAAVLVAAGVVPIAHASDGGGSIRIPAACCGLVGYKPSRGLLDMQGSSLLPVNIAVDGVITRTVRDTEAFHAALARSKPRPAPPLKLRIGVFVDAPTATPVHADTQAAVLAAARACEALGHHVTQVPCPFSGDVIDDFLRFWGFVSWIQIKTARLMMHRRFDVKQLEPWTTGIARTFTLKRWGVIGAIRRLRRFRRTYARVMDSYDVMVSPATAEPAPLLGYLATDQPFETKFARLRSYVPFTPLHNVSGAPAISLPLGRTSTELPIGVMFAAARQRSHPARARAHARGRSPVAAARAARAVG